MIKNFKIYTVLFLCFSAAIVRAQSIPAAVMEHIRAGSNDISRKTGAVRVPLVGRIDMPVLDVYVNGMGPFKFLFDAGASVVTIAQWVTERAKVSTLIKRSGKSVLMADSISIGSATFKQVAAVNVKELDLDGVIGFNMFRDGLLTIDYPGQRFTWSTGSLPEADGKTILNYELRERMPYIPLRIGKDTLWFNMDTGASGWLYLPAVFKNNLKLIGSLHTGDHSWNGEEGSFNSEKGKLADEVYVGNYQIKNAEPNFSTHIEEPLLGSNFFKYFILRFDLKNRRVQFLKKTEAVICMPD